MKILIIQTASLGDVILSTALANSIKSEFPNYKVHFLIKKNYSAVFNDNLLVDKVLLWDKSRNKYANLFKLLKKIRAKRYDVVINLHRFLSTGFLTAFSKGKIKIGYKQNPLSFLFNFRAKHQRIGIHETARNLNLANLYFKKLELKKPVLSVIKPKDDVLNIISDKKYITIFPGSLWKTKMFHVEGWQDFIKTIPLDLIVVCMGAANDYSVVQQIITSRQENSYNFCGKTNILETAWIMKNAYMNFTNDSAPTHIASSVDAPVSTIFCSTIPDFGFTPVSSNSNIIENIEKLSCRPCGIHGHKSCPENHFKCATGIKTAQLLQNI